MLGKFILRRNLIKDKNGIYLNRRKGIVVVPEKKQPPKEIPFADFDAYLGSSVNSSGSVSYHLWLGHRYSEIRVASPSDTTERWKIFQEWETWQRYMDISKPLPDTPRFEPFRSRDPVTAAYDREHNRPADYWKNLNIHLAELMHRESQEAAAKFPWGMNRKQALEIGWRPSEAPEGDWKRES
jgi:hypothetical protein